MTVLVVDDDLESRKLLTSMLGAEGYQVYVADGGELALASLAIRRPDLILLDVRMTGIDGFEVCRRLKERTDSRDIPIIFLTAAMESAERLEGFRLGAVDFVTKPFQREELLARVRTHLELSQLRAALQVQVEERTAELRESEQRFRTMADAAPVMIWASGPDKCCTFVNRGWLEFTGRSLEEELGEGWANGVHRDDVMRCLKTYSDCFNRRRPFKMEYRLRRADGEYRWILDHGVPRSSSGRFAGYVGSCIDITELHENHERLIATQKLESLGLMAAAIAHDFGNVLNAILAEADLALSEMEPASPGRENIEKICGAGTFAIEIVRLLMTSAGAGVDSSSLDTIDVSQLVKETLRLLSVSISKQAVVNSQLAADLPPIRGNVAKIRQVIMNLIMNASDALGAKSGTITVSTAKAFLKDLDAPANRLHGDCVRIRVSDTGCGMTPDVRSRIFDQFFTTKSNGRGLGLAAVHGIVRSHGGAINVESTAGVGSTFEVLLPCARRHRPSSVRTELPRQETAVDAT